MNAAVSVQQNLQPQPVGVQSPIMSALSHLGDDRQIIHPTGGDPVKKLVTATPKFEKYTSTSPTTKKEGNKKDPKPVDIQKPCCIM